jgi:hypothetical protein
MVPDDIKYFNWAAYVMEELFIAARDVQHTIKQKKPITTITGCSILLQVWLHHLFHCSRCFFIAALYLDGSLVILIFICPTIFVPDFVF